MEELKTLTEKVRKILLSTRIWVGGAGTGYALAADLTWPQSFVLAVAVLGYICSDTFLKLKAK